MRIESGEAQIEVHLLDFLQFQRERSLVPRGTFHGAVLQCRERPQAAYHERDGEAVGVNASIPILFSASEKRPTNERSNLIKKLRDEQERIARDVRVAWASAMDAYQRIDLTAQFLRSATLGLQLAQGRYDLGLASIVELTRSQLNVTNAEIENLDAKYDHQIQYAALQFTLGLLR